MKAILGIDAAWTSTQPSGVALILGEGRSWQLLSVHASYENFLAQADPALASVIPGMWQARSPCCAQVKSWLAKQ